MATTSRPRPPFPGGSPPIGARNGDGGGEHPPVLTWQRVLAVGALALIAFAIGYLIFAGGGGTEYRIDFNSASQLVLGDQVQVGGVPVGTIKKITLVKHLATAQVTVEVEGRLAPLHQGTTAQIRVPSLSSVAARYISLAPGPNNLPALPAGAVLPSSATKGVVNIDELFNMFTPKTRKGLAELVEGFATQYQGTGKAVGQATDYFPPAVQATDNIFKELLREEGQLSSFLVQGAKATTVLAAHKQQLGRLVADAGKTFAAAGSEQESLKAGLTELPSAFKEGTKTFKELPSTLAALEELINVSKPNTKHLALFFERLKPLLAEATPVSRELSVAIHRPGPNNDLTDFALALPGLAKSLQTASPSTVKALNESVPVTAFFGPYAPDLIGLFHDFGQQTGYYDANGHYARVSPDFADFKLSEGKLIPVTPAEGLQGLKTGQLTRCPGAATQPAADGSSPFTDEGKLGCNPSEVP